MRNPPKVYISYSHLDQAYLNTLLIHLTPLERNGKINLTYDGKILPGAVWDDELKRMQREADILLVLVSHASIASRWVDSEVDFARHDKRKIIIPIILTPVDWLDTPLAEFQALPENAVPVSLFKNKDEAYAQIVRGIEKVATLFGNSWQDIINEERVQRTGSLDLSHCGLSTLPSELYDMNWLTSIDLSSNAINDVRSLAELKKLQKINLSQNSLTDIRHLEIFQVLKNLSSLNLSHNGISNMQGLTNLSTLTFLNLEHNMIEEVRALKISSLKVLNLSHNFIKKIKWLDLLASLETLELHNNDISRIEGLDTNINLRVLGLSSNQINKLENIAQLEKLETLYAAQNVIEDISILQELPSLTRIVLTANKISNITPLRNFIENDIPVLNSYSFDETEKGIFIAKNPLKNPPMEVIIQGKDAILRYFEVYEESETEQLTAYESSEVKVILLGNPNVGKTHLAEYIESNRTALPDNNASTKGMVNKLIKYGLPQRGKHIKMRIFDFGGQDYYHDTHHLFFTNDTIYLLLWEKSSNVFGRKTEVRYKPEQVANADETNDVFPVAYWVDAVSHFIQRKNKASARKKGQDNTIIEKDIAPVLILVETKRGKNGGTLLDTSSLMRFSNLIHSQAAISLYKENGKIVNTGTAALFDGLNDLVDQMTEKQWPGYYRLIIEFFEQITKTANKKLLQLLEADGLVVNLAKCQVLFNSIVRKKASYEFDVDGTRDLCRFLDNRGYMLFFDENKICLSPENLTQELYAVLNKSYSALGMISSEEAKENKPDIMSIMQDFKLVIAHPGGNGFIVPQLLPDRSSSELDLFLNAFKPPCVRYRLPGYVHKNVVQELYDAFRHDLIMEKTQDYIWKNGFVVRIAGELYKIDIRNSKDSRLIEIQFLNRFHANTIKKICKTIENILMGRDYSHEISLDGTLFVPIDQIVSNLNLSQFVWEKRLLRIADYKDFLDDDRKEYAMKKLFISYSSKDLAFMKEFVTHLEPFRRNGKIDYWYDRMIEPGSKWDDAIRKELDSSDIVIFLLSPDFIATSYIFEIEIPAAIERLKQQNAKLFFIQLLDCSWEQTILSEYQQTTDKTKNTKELITITDAMNHAKWKQAVGELSKLLVKSVPN